MHNTSHKHGKIDAETQFLKIKSLVAWLISEGRVDQKQIINFVQPNSTTSNHKPALIIYSD